MNRQIPEQVIEAFAKLLAPRPRVLVFVELDGLKFAAVEVPKTHQVILGVSIELYDTIRNSIFEETGLGIEDRVDLQYVQGHVHTIPVLTERSYMVPYSEAVANGNMINDIKIMPKPLEIGVVKPIDRK